MTQRLISKSFRTPKGCHVKSIHLDSDKRQAEVSYDCGGYGSGSFPTPEGGTSNYPKALVKNVHGVRTPGTNIYGNTRIGFELSPRSVTCRKTESETEMRCMLHSGKTTLSGSRRKR